MNNPARAAQYLDNLIDAASPARLRLMLIEKAIDVSGCLADVWRKGEQLGANEHSIKLLDLLNELLSGVNGSGDADEELCVKVADLYVFLAKHLVAAEPASDAASIDEIKTVLAAEAETWRAVCAQESGQMQPQAEKPLSSAEGLNFEA